MEIRHPPSRSIPRLGLLLLAILLLTSCINLGPRSLEAGRTDYNRVLHDTADQQLLENLVRLRYRDRPYFLEIASVTTQFSYGSRVMPITLFRGLGIDDEVLTEIEGSYEESPTIAYVPLQGEDFARRILAPVPLESVVLLANSGWSLERLLRVCVERLNDVPNAVSASGPTPDRAPRFREFLEVARAVRELQVHDRIALGAAPGGPAGTFAVVLREGAEGTPGYGTLAERLGLDRARSEYGVRSGLGATGDGVLDVQTRSVSGILHLLSHGVDIPEAHAAKGWVTETRDEDGRPFDWGELTDGLLVVRSSREKPQDAAVRIRYRDHWFWIADADLNSKSTFSLLSQLFALQAGAGSGSAPVLTLPVGS